MSEDNGGDVSQNGALLSDPVDVIIDKLLRYDRCYGNEALQRSVLYGLYGASMRLGWNFFPIYNERETIGMPLHCLTLPILHNIPPPVSAAPVRESR
jgi:hypothetical protein